MKVVVVIVQIVVVVLDSVVIRVVVVWPGETQARGACENPVLEFCTTEMISVVLFVAHDARFGERVFYSAFLQSASWESTRHCQVHRYVLWAPVASERFIGFPTVTILVTRTAFVVTGVTSQHGRVWPSPDVASYPIANPLLLFCCLLLAVTTGKYAIH
jgi:hypothetical protein